MQTFLKYESYKDSGVEWLGKVPDHWKVERNFGLFDERKEINQPDMELLSVTIEQGVIKQNEITTKKDSSNEDKSKYKVVLKGDLAYNKMRMWQGAIGMSDYDGIVSPAYIILNTRDKAYSKYFHYLYRTELFIKEADRHSYGLCDDMNSLRYEHFKTIHSPVPSREEVKRITNFLDQKTAEIDEAISKKQRLIGLLKEQKAILINQAVTKGLNPKVSMRDSGVEWIGEIPEHWQVKRLRYTGKTQNGISAGADYFGSGYPFVSYSDVYNNTELPKIVNGLAKSTDEDRANYSVLGNDVFFTRTSETIEEIGYSSVCMNTINDATFAGFLIRFRPNKKLFFKGYSKYFFSSEIHRGFFIKEMNLVTRASLSQEILKRMPVLIPPQKDQEQIFDFLESKTTGFNEAITLQKQQIEKLREYTATLINSAVTGKIRVS